MTQRQKKLDGLLTEILNGHKSTPSHPGQFLYVHTQDHVNCPACDAARVDRLRTIEQDMAFDTASAIWLEMCKEEPVRVRNKLTARHKRLTTMISYDQYVTSLNLFFGGVKLKEIHLGHLREFVRLRRLGTEMFVRRRRPHEEPAVCPVAAKKINQEMGILRRILRRAGCWNEELENFYIPEQEEERDVQRALSREEQELWLYTAQQCERWKVVYWYSVLGISQTLATNELRFMRRGDINLFNRTTHVSFEGAKNKKRVRTISIDTAEALWAAEKLLEYAAECGSVDPQHYVFPLRNRKYDYNPTKPMSNSGLKKPWQEIRERAGLLWFRQYDLRHTGATRNAEDGMNEAIRDYRMGHATKEMREHYTHITAQAQRIEFERMQRERSKWRPATTAYSQMRYA